MKRDPREEESLQEGLRRLRQLGYLRSPAEHFVAQRVPGNASPWRVALTAGLWLGVGGGILLALILALSLLIAQPNLLRNPTDFAILSLELLVTGAVLGGMAASLVTWPLMRHRRRGRPAAPGVERAVFFVLCLLPALYLADLFGRFLLPRLGGTLWFAAMGLGALVAAFFGEGWGRLLRTLVTVAAMKSGTHASLQASSRGWFRVLLVAATLGLLVLGPYRGLRALPRLDQISPPKGSLHPPRPLTVVFADGVSPRDCPGTLELLGDPPQPLNDGQALDGGALAPPPESFWSCVATGFPPEIHGLQTAAAKAPAGVSSGLVEVRDQPLLKLVVHGLLPGVGLGNLRAHDQRELLRPPFWEIAAHLGVRATVINAWATYPAARHEGLALVSDRCFLRLWDGKDAGNDPLLLQPPRPDLLQVAQSALAGRSEYASVESGDSLLSRLPFRQLETFREVWDYAAASDLFHAFLAEEALGADDPSELVVLQLNGADMVHRAISQCGIGPAREVALRLERKYLNFTDRLLQDLMKADLSRKRVLVLSRLSADSSRKDREAWVWPSDLSSTGDLYRLAPVLLRALGIPPARDMDMDDTTARGPASWGLRPAWTPAAARSPEDLERLRSLGYIGSQKGK